VGVVWVGPVCGELLEVGDGLGEIKSVLVGRGGDGSELVSEEDGGKYGEVDENGEDCGWENAGGKGGDENVPNSHCLDARLVVSC